MLFSNPDIIHLSLSRNHARWAVFLRGLRYIVVDNAITTEVFAARMGDGAAPPASALRALRAGVGRARR